MPRVKRSQAVLVLTAALAGCATGGTPDMSDLSVRSSLECRIESFPAVLPGPDMLVDTAALSDDLRELQEAFDTAALRDRQVAVSMAYQTDGLNMRRDILAHDTEPAVADTVQKLVFANRLHLPEAEQEWGVRLLIDLDEDISYRVERREYCPPQPHSRELESAMSTYLTTGMRYQAGERVRTVVVRVRVHPAGYVEEGSIVRGGVPGSTLEQALLSYVRQFSFVPATVDGMPTYGHVDIPVQVGG